MRSPGGASTGAVLWLMILLVFLPIIGLHGLARVVVHEPPQVVAALAPR